MLLVTVGMKTSEAQLLEKPEPKENLFQVSWFDNFSGFRGHRFAHAQGLVA